MLKFIGILCLGMGCFGLGWHLSLKLITQQKSLSLFLELVRRMKEEIRFYSGSVCSMMERISHSPPFEGEEVFSYLYESVKSGSDFFTAMDEGVRRFEKELCLNEEDIRLLNAFGQGIGTTDTAGQTEHCQRCERMIEARISDLCEQHKPKIKLFRSGGLLAGIFLAILLL